MSSSNREKYGYSYPYRFEQIQTLNLVLNYRFSPSFEFSTRFNYASNFPFTPPVKDYPEVNGDSIAVNPFTRDVIFVWILGNENLNSDRKPAYHRLDLRGNILY
ncbi:MAG: hypothetical protein R3A12_10605 [Ignavibacteria bacterium]